MVGSAHRSAVTIGLVCLVVWSFGLSSFILKLRWDSVKRPGPPLYEAFPYGEIRIGVDASYSPFAYVLEGELYGFDIDVGKEIAERLGYPYRFINMGYDGLYDSVTADQVDILISALLIDPHRLADIRYTSAYFDAGLVLVWNQGSTFTDISDLESTRIAFEFGSASDSLIRKWLRRYEGFDTQAYELSRYALDALRIRKADYALVDAVSYALYQKEHGDWKNDFEIVDPAPISIAIRSDRLATWELVEQKLIEMKADGGLKQILEQWLFVEK